MEFITEDTEGTEEDKNCKLQIADSPFCNLHFEICILQSYVRVLCVLCGYSLFARAGIAAPQEVVPVVGDTFEGELVSIGGDGKLTFRVPKSTVAEVSAPSERALEMEELVRWGHPVEARPQTMVVLADGGRLVTAADWAGGAAVRVDGDAVVVLSDVFNERRLPCDLVRVVVFAQRNHPEERAALMDRVRTYDDDQDAVFLSNEDQLVGRLKELTSGSLSMATEAGVAKLPLSRVEAVALGSRQSSVVSRQSRLVLGLRDGSVLYAEAVRSDVESLVLELSNGVKLSGGGVADVVALQSLGGRLVYLSDLKPAAYRHVPYLDIEWPYERDRNVMGQPLVVGGKRYIKGLGMHSASRLTYRLDGAYRRFDAAIAVDDSAEKGGSVTFGVYVSRGGRWQEAYQSGVVRGGDAPQAVSVDVRGAEGLTLTVDYADRGDELDRAVCLDARLVEEEM
jgi:hypothetical protein